MPELPEVEAARRLAERHLCGKEIVQVATAADDIVYDGVTPRRVGRALRGRHVTGTDRRGKLMWFALDTRPWPLFHFGMTGSFHVYEERRERPRFWNIELTMNDGTRRCMTDMRRLGRIRLRQDPQSEEPVSGLGFDPLLALPRATTLADALARRRAPIKSVLLDQALFAGVGNWVADEVLYQAGLDPRRLASDLELEEVRRLRRRLGQIIRKACAVEADSKRFPRTWLFHHRWGRRKDSKTARGETIIFDTIGGRTTAWAPASQR